MGAVDQYLFIEPGHNLQKDDPELKQIVDLTEEELRQRWNTDKGNTIIARLKKDRFSRTTLDNLIGRYYEHYDVRGIPLVGEDLRGLDLSMLDLFASNLENANLEKADLTKSWLSESNLKGTCLDWAVMKDALVDNVQFDNKTSFVGVNLNEVNFNLAVLLQDLALTQQRISNLKKTRPVLSKFLEISCDFGRSFGRFIGWVALIIFVFGLVYFFIPKGLSVDGFGNCLYFSVVTFTTLGYGDIEPVSALAKIAVAAEVLLGYLMLGLLVAILSKKVFGN